MSSLGKPLPHDSAREHVRGEAAYVDDLPPQPGELFVGIVGSPVAHGRIKRVDLDAVLKCAGIAAAFTWTDVPGHNDVGPVLHDEELLASEFVHYHGQPIALVAGADRAAVLAAVKKARVTVEPLPAVLTIEQAIAQEQFLGPTRYVARGDAPKTLERAEHRLSGELNIGGQEHFYLEAQAAIAWPGEAGEINLLSSTQHPTECQTLVARVLGLPLAKVVCTVRRMGGGFGGKETQAAQPAMLAALVAHLTRRPARCVFGHEQDFRTTGKRHPYLVCYDAGFDSSGRITALRSDFYSNGGFSLDLSIAVMERTLLHAENAYYIPDVQFGGTVCRTNLPSNTAFRGFGGPQGVAAMENVIEEIAGHLGLDPFDVRRINLYGVDDRNVTPYGQVIRHNKLPEVLDQLVESSDYRRRVKEAELFNQKSKTHLKGVALTPVKFGISFTRRTYNQGNAHVALFLDGTVQVSTGGTEMGQGLNTKIRQLVADQFGVPPQSVRVMPTSTDRNHNTSPTAASAGTDLNGTAAVRACDQIVRRLAAVAAPMLADEGLEPAPECMAFADGFVLDSRDPSRRAPLHEVAARAYDQRVDLGARGFYATPGVDFNRPAGRGTPFLYFTNGAAVAEVRVDRFTGEVTLDRVDLLMDLGRMINPAIDRGQVVGGFIQGVGWVTTEALVYGDDGTLLSDSATTYKIPNATDVPADFRVDFLENPDNRDNVYGSKAVGEPPLLLGVAVWAAVKRALLANRPGTKLDLPATNEELLKRLYEPASVNTGAPVKAPAAAGS